MRRILFMILLIWGVCCLSYGQNRGIIFEKGTWEEVLEKAKKQNKLVFLECYLSRCPSCKKLATEVFTNDTVADYYNTHFIPMQVLMEKGEGKELRKAFQVQSFPTLLYLDGAGNVQHKVVGFCTPEELIRTGERALDGNHNYAALVKRYETGDRDASFVREYLMVLVKGAEQKKLEGVTQEYLEGLDDASFYTQEAWQYIYQGVTDPLSSSFQRLIDGLEKFYTLVGQEVVEQKLAKVFSKAVSDVMGASSWKEDEYQRLIMLLRNLPFDGSYQYLAKMYVAKCIHDGEYSKMLEHINFVLDYNLSIEQRELQYFLFCMPSLSKVKEPEAMKKAVVLVDRLIPFMKHPLLESLFLEQKAILLDNLGETEQAISVRTAIEITKKKIEESIGNNK